MAGASHGGNQMNELNRIAENALKIAAESTDLQAMESAIKIDTAVKKINEQEHEARWVRFAKGVGPAIGLSCSSCISHFVIDARQSNIPIQ